VLLDIVPNLFPAIRLAAGISLIVALTVEITANPLGLGCALVVAQEKLDPATMFAYLIWIGLIGWLLNAGCFRRKADCSTAGVLRHGDMVTEMMSTETGLGVTILYAARSFRSYLIGFGINAAMDVVPRHLLRWRT
jgi:ABC-type nitrate/sulfonate/bicarbonate transport system permease component